MTIRGARETRLSSSSRYVGVNRQPAGSTRPPDPPARLPTARFGLPGGNAQVWQRELGYLAEGRRGDLAAVVAAPRLVHDDDRERPRVLHGREADERRDEVGLRVAALDGLLDGAGLAREPVAGDATSEAVPPGASTPSSMCRRRSAVCSLITLVPSSCATSSPPASRTSCGGRRTPPLAIAA